MIHFVLLPFLTIIRHFEFVLMRMKQILEGYRAVPTEDALKQVASNVALANADQFAFSNVALTKAVINKR